MNKLTLLYKCNLWVGILLFIVISFKLFINHSTEKLNENIDFMEKDYIALLKDMHIMNIKWAMRINTNYIIENRNNATVSIKPPQSRVIALNELNNRVDIILAQKDRRKDMYSELYRAKYYRQ